MSVVPLILRPGVDLQKTKLMAGEERVGEANWVSCNLIRFDHSCGQIQKIGGWAQLIAQALIGTCRGMMSWSDFFSTNYLALGTEQRLSVYTYGAIYDITPIVHTSNLAGPYTIFNGQPTVTVTDGYSTNVGDWINILNPISIGNLLLQGYYKVQTVGSGNYTITSPINATSDTSGGTAAQFVTANTQSTITVNLNNHGLSNGSSYTVYVSTTVANVTLLGTYTVTNVNNANQFTFSQGTVANSNASAFENSGNSRVQYLLPNGLVSSTSASGYGQNIYNLGYYGYGAMAGSELRLRQWFLGKWGQGLVANPTNDGIYYWDATGGLTNNPATVIATAPNPIGAGIFVASEQQMIIALAAGPSAGVSDPMLVRWCDAGDYTVWTATASNQAGSFRLQRGSKVMGGLPTPQQNLIWTDTTLYAMSYLGLPFVWGFTPVGQSCGLLAARAANVLGDTVLWMSQRNFFQYEGGAPVVLPCSVWDQVFSNLNTVQYDKIFSAPNTYFNEMSWFYPSLAGNGEVDSYVKYQKDLKCFDYGSLGRTAWVDQTAFGPPMGVDTNGIIQQHEISPDANGSAINSWAQTAWFKIAEGELFLFVERMLTDFKMIQGDPTILMTIYTQDFGNSGETLTYTYGPFTITKATEFVITRARGRIASIRIESNDIGSLWRLGAPLYYVAPSGRRF